MLLCCAGGAKVAISLEFSEIWLIHQEKDGWAVEEEPWAWRLSSSVEPVFGNWSSALTIIPPSWVDTTHLSTPLQIFVAILRLE